jgi:wyosine [tRNA(Phe)-imidazoG37] synthetase (radical SAM superfamily)
MSTTILYTKLGWRCNAECVFCAVGDYRGPRELPTEFVVEQLKLGRQYNATLLTISGGEPTVRHDLPLLIQVARELGYTGVHIQTNGRALGSEHYCRKLLDAGATKFIVSLHGHTPTLHDRLTQAKGSFAQTSRGIRNLAQLASPRLLQTNTTIVTENYRYLFDIVLYLESLGVTRINLSYVQPSGVARSIMTQLSPRMTDVAVHVHRVFQRPNAHAYVVTDGIPPCLLAEHNDLTRNQLYTPARLIGQNGEWRVYRVMSGYQVCGAGQSLEYPAVLKILPPGTPLEEEEEIDHLYYAPDCERCAIKPQCPGVWAYYVEQYGLSEFQPI